MSHSTGSVEIFGGTVGILNVGEGDTKLSFDPSNPAERIRAARIVKDMLRRGYALLIEVKGKDGAPSTYRRAYDFDEDACEYIIADFDPVTAQAADEEESNEPPTASEDAAPAGKSRKAGKPRGIKTKTVPAENARAISVGRSAGG